MHAEVVADRARYRAQHGVDRTVAERGLAVLPKATIRDFVGKGMANLGARALAAAGAPVAGPDELAPILARYQEIYAALASAFNYPS